MAFGAKEGVPNEDATWEYERILQQKNLKLLDDKQYWVGRNVMSPFLIIAQQDNSINPTSSLGWMDTFGILIRELINDVRKLEWNKYLIMYLIK